MKNSKKRILSLVMALAILASLSTAVLAANGWTWGQEKAHEAADIVRDVGGNRYAANAALSSYWWSQSGRGTSNDFYYDSYANTTYYADGRILSGLPYQNQQNQQQNNQSNGIAFKYSGYLWYQTREGTFYRWNGTKQVWATDSENDNILKNGTFQGRNYYDSYGTGEHGTTWNDGYYTWTWDSSTGKYYRYQNGTKVWYDGTNGNQQQNQQNSYTYYDGTYTWYWDSSVNRYYRYQNNQKIWKDGTSGGGNQQNQQNSNIYANQNYYNGVFTGTDNYVNKDEALILARMIYSYAHGESSMTRQAAMGWAFLNYAGSSSLASKTGAFSDYNANSPTVDDLGRDLQLLARDILFRYQAERSGITEVGRVLPKEYTWIWVEGNGTVYFRTSQYGANYQFATSGQYRSPYST